MPISKTVLTLLMCAVSTVLSVKSRNCSLNDKFLSYSTEKLKAIYLYELGVVFNEPASPYDTSLQGKLFGNLSCGEPVHDVTQAIIGGQDAPEKAWPWQVTILLHLFRFELILCGGSLISESWILTAAHCASLNIDKLEIKLGVRNIDAVLEPHREYVRALNVIIHPDYEPVTSTADIALIKLDKKVVFNDYIRPICLPKESEMLENDNFCFITGWGITNVSKTKAATLLQQTQVNIMPQSLCSYIWAVSKKRIRSLILCLDLQDEYRSACSGDSGGPLACKIDGKFVLCGVASGVYRGCMSRVYPGLYVSVTAYIDWIVTTIAENVL